MCPGQSRVVAKITEALRTRSSDPAQCAHGPVVAVEIEKELVQKLTAKEAAQKARSLVFNLTKNDDLRRDVLLRKITAQDLCAASSNDLATDTMKQERIASTERYFAMRLTNSDAKVVGWDAGTSGKLEGSHKFDEKVVLQEHGVDSSPADQDEVDAEEGDGDHKYGDADEGYESISIAESSNGPVETNDHEQGKGLDEIPSDWARAPEEGVISPEKRSLLAVDLIDHDSDDELRKWSPAEGGDDGQPLYSPPRTPSPEPDGSHSPARASMLAPAAHTGFKRVLDDIRIDPASIADMLDRPAVGVPEEVILGAIDAVRKISSEAAKARVLQ